MQPQLQVIHRTGWRIEVDSPYGLLVHEVRLTCQDGRWVARIVTLPKLIWIAPDGKHALTFEAATEAEAERLAVEFIEKDRIARGYRLRVPGSGREGRDGGQAADGLAARRIEKEFPVRFAVHREGGSEKPGALRYGTTGNLSESGIFIATEALLEPGTQVVVELQISGLRERMQGEVVWVRRGEAPSRLKGIGVRLLSPPLSYRARVQSL